MRFRPGPTLSERSTHQGATGLPIARRDVAGAASASRVNQAAGQPVVPTGGEESVGGVGFNGSARHCWVVGLPHSSGRWPGLLLAWCHRPDGTWAGHVSYAVLDRGALVLVQAWVPAAYLRPVSAAQNPYEGNRGG